MAGTNVKKMLPPGTTVWWVDIADAATKEDLLKSTLYTGASAKAKDISCAITTGFDLGATGSTTSSVAGICDSAEVETPVGDKYEASLTFFREAFTDDAAGMNATSPAAIAFNLFKKGGASANTTGWLVTRVGHKPGTPVKAGQLVSGYKVTPDNPRDVIGDASAPILMEVKFLQAGEMFTFEAIKA